MRIGLDIEYWKDDRLHVMRLVNPMSPAEIVCAARYGSMGADEIITDTIDVSAIGALKVRMVVVSDDEEV